MKWLYLFIAVVSEVAATLSLKESEGFTKLVPSLITIAGYSLAFYAFALTLKYIPVSIAYAVWSGLGIVMITLLSFFFLKQKIDFPAILGIFFILIGVIVINIFSKTLSR